MVTEHSLTDRVAVFDLDHTLLDGDTNQLWVDFLIGRGALPVSVRDLQQEYMARYAAQTLDIDAYLVFQLGLLAPQPIAHWLPLRKRFVLECIAPRISTAANEAVSAHLGNGDGVLIITATHSFLSEAIGALFGIEVVAPKAEEAGGMLTGRIVGPVSFGAGKVTCLQRWMEQAGMDDATTVETWFYSDSINDLPLLEAVARPVVVNADPSLAAHAERRGWETRTWRVEIPAALEN